MSIVKKEDLKYLVALSNFPKFGPVRFKKLSAYFENWQSAFSARLSELREAGIEDNIASEFLAARDKLDPDALMAAVEKENIKIITPSDDKFPKLLREIYDPPMLLYLKGTFEESDEFAVAVVGTRKFTSYGKQAAAALAGDLARNKLTIVSGLALGIDTIAHVAALEALGRTIAVLGTGVDKASIYPSANRYLADTIVASGGAVISEFPLTTQPFRHNFPQRNRIISGLALGTLVVEAAEKSGALITARFALDQNREVYAVPGSIFSEASIGPNALIKQGAKPVSVASEILDALDLSAISAYIDNKKTLPETEEEIKIVEYLSREPRHVNDLIRLTNLNASVINSTLTLMEMKGMVKNLGGMQYVLAR